MKKKLLTLLCILAPLGVLAQGWPANYQGVMLQGFYWDSYEDAKWTTLTSQADELSQYFKLIWVPNSGQTKEDQWNSPGNWGYENMGYSPVYWLRHNTCFGSQEELMTMISTFKAKGTGFIEDVVINHKNGLTNWADFPNETVTGPTTGNTYTVTWASNMSNLWGICSNDEVFTNNGGLHDGVQYTCGSAAADEADNFDGCRDLDHTNVQVQQNIYNYLDFLIKELGYVGFRYDMVKGYKAYYTGLYNLHAQPEFSVGEYWDASFDNVVGYWVKETGLPQGADNKPQSAAFDFPLKYVMNDVFNNNHWSALSNKGIAGSPEWNRYAVTFVDNHDTYRNESDRVNNNVLAANALILTMPGTPCVFLPHWQEYKPEIKKMIAAREAAGITNQSTISTQYEIDGNKGYYIKVTGTKGSIILTLGNLLDTTVDTDQHELVLSGNNFAMYLWNGVYNQKTYDDIDAESAKSITVYVRDNSQGAPYLYAWNGGDKLNGEWPGKQLTETTTLADGSTWYRQTFNISSLNVIVTFNDGKQSGNVEEIRDDIYLCYYKGDDGKYADYTSYYKGNITGNTVNAYFDAPDGWNKAFAWCTKFYDFVNLYLTVNDWPGDAMTKVGTSSTGNDIYCWSIPKNLDAGVPNKILFNDGNNKTSGFDFINAAYYDFNGIASENRLYFYPTVLRNATQVSGTNWDGNTATLAQGDASTTMEHELYYPAGSYTVQAIVRGSADSQVTLTVGPADLANAGTATVSLTGIDGATSTVTTDGVVETVATGTNNGWHKVQAHYVLSEEGVLRMALASDAGTWQVGAVTIIKNADTQNYFRTSATLLPTETNADVANMTNFSFYDRGVNKNALVTAYSGQSPASLPCNVIVDGNCENLMLTDGAYDFFAPASFTASAVSYDRNFTEGKKMTVCLPFAVSDQDMTDLGIEAYDFDGMTNSGGFHFTQVQAMEANHPYVVVADGKVFENLEGRDVAMTGALDNTISDVTFTGTMKRVVLNSDNSAIYYGYSNGQFVKVGNNVGVNPFRAYVKTGNDLGAAVAVVFDDTQTSGVRDVNAHERSESIIYRLDGRRMGGYNCRGSLPKGVYVCNGKKFVVK